jgi:putative secretion ATPase (PEP-CTERM system associated)
MMNDHYGLAGRPFQLTPDPRFWFESGTHKKAMAYLGYGLSQGEGFVVITGEVGAGKTTLVGHLLRSIDPVRVHAIAIASTQVEGDDMLRLVAQGLDIPTAGQDKAGLLSKVERSILDRAAAGQKTLLIVDEAQNLPVSSLEELRMLSNVQAGGQAVLQTLLLGQPEFRDRLRGADALEQLRQRVIATHHLGPMESDETGPYVEHRMKLVGWTGSPGFSADAFAMIHAHAGGMPRKINALMTRVLLAGALEQADVIDGALVRSVIADLDEDQVSGPDIATASARKQAEKRGHDPVTLDLAARVAMLEAQSEEQGTALRRVLGLLVDWVEAEEARLASADVRRAPAA